jgi:cytidylate kinase
MKKIITITGDLGSGKSTVSALLCNKLHYDYIYTGSIQRAIAERFRMTTLELNRYAETHPEIDAEIDATFKTLGQETSNLVVDSRLAWFFIPDSFKVYLTTDVYVSATRIANDALRRNEGVPVSIEETVNKIIERKTSENKRYMELYGVDCSDMSKFTLILDTSDITPDEAAERIIREYTARLSPLSP